MDDKTSQELLDGFRKRSDKKSELDRISQEKLLHEAVLVRWHLKTKWWPLIISVVSLIVAIVALLKSTF